MTAPWPSIPSMGFKAVWGSSYQIWWPWGISKPLILGWPQFNPCMTFEPINALPFGQGFFLPNLVAVGHSGAIWPLVDPGWPLHDIWPHHCTTLWSRVAMGHFQGNLTSGWSLTFGGVALKICSQNSQTSLAVPYPMPIFSFTPQSTTKRIAVNPY